MDQLSSLVQESILENKSQFIETEKYIINNYSESKVNLIMKVDLWIDLDQG